MVAKNDPEMEITDEEFNNLINNSHKLVVVDFFAEWCMPCIMLAPIVDELANSMKEVKFVKINIDDNKELASKHSVMSIPTLVIFKDGEEVDRIMGGQTADVLEDKIKKHLE